MDRQDAKLAPLIWPSLARMAATASIFLFHFLGLLGRPQYNLDAYALLTFCFLSGYLANLRRSNRRSAWAVRRFFAVLVPHWLVIIPVVIANQIFHYKSVGLGSTIVTILGGNLFLANPLYVITWYVTFVLLLYSYALLESFATPPQRILLMGVGLLLFSVPLGRGYYFLAFLAGLRLADWRSRHSGTRQRQPAPRLAHRFFVVQRYCYSFFLLHGAVLVFFFTETRIPAPVLLPLAFLSSAGLAVVCYKVAQPLQRIAVTRLLGQHGKALDTSPAV